MSLIATIDPKQATGEVAEIYARAQAKFGAVPNGFRVWSASPRLLKQFLDSIDYYMSHPSLSFPTLAVIRLLVSVDQRCDYCVDMNMGLLMQMAGWSLEQIQATRADLSAAPLPERDQALVALVIKAVKASNSITAEDLEAVRAHSWNDGDILDAVNHGARQVAGDIVFNAFRVERDN